LKEKKKVKGHVALHMIKERRAIWPFPMKKKIIIIIIRGNASFSLRTERRKEEKEKMGKLFSFLRSTEIQRFDLQSVYGNVILEARSTF